jgi:hypothetical protein
MKKEYPVYVKIECDNGTTHSALRYNGNGIYYRDAGNWYLQSEYVGDELHISKEQDHNYINHLCGRRLIEIPAEEWEEDNKDYV